MCLVLELVLLGMRKGICFVCVDFSSFLLPSYYLLPTMSDWGPA